MGKWPTIKDVAERAGVSRGTVDRVINGRGRVYKPVHERVLKAVDELGYVPPREKHQQIIAEAGYTYLPLKCLHELLHLRKKTEADLTNAPINVFCSQNIS